jgi:hypothetical protein
MQRKLLIAFGFLVGTTYLVALAIYRGASLIDLSTVIFAQSAGVGALMFGFASEYKNKPTETPKAGV